MGISKEFLRDQMKKLETNYGKDRFLINQEMFDLWYEVFSDCEAEGLKLAVINCMKDCEYAPNIAKLMKCYKELSI